MAEYTITGSCYCSNIQFILELTRALEHYKRSVCDCDFCRKHGAAYIFDKKGKLTVSVNSEAKLNKYRQGSKLVDFFICKQCGVLIGAFYSGKAGKCYTAINSRTVDGAITFGQEMTVTPKVLSDSDKIQLWQSCWIQDVRF